MSKLWFLLTLMLDTFPFMLVTVISLKDKLKRSLPVSIIEMTIGLMSFNLVIFFTYMNGMYGQKLMVALRVSACLLSWVILCVLFNDYYIQFLYKCFFVLPYMLAILQISAFCMNFVNTEGMPDFMMISLLRLMWYIFLSYPYYILENRFILKNLERGDNRIWVIFSISQFILNLAMITSIRTDYAANGVDIKSFSNQLLMFVVTITTSFLLFYGINLLQDVEIIKEQKKRDELLVELNAKQYQIIQENIEQSRHFRHDIKHHMRVLEQLMFEKKYEEVVSYLNEYQDKIPEGIKIKFCENVSVNALLEYYYSDAIEKEINVSFDVAPLADCKVDDIDLNILLGNAIENAIEACMNVESRKRMVKVCTKIMKNQIFITVDNYFDGVIKNSEGKFLSKKRKFKKTGYGNASMDAVAAKYKGEIRREINGNNYQVSIMLRM